LHESRLLHVYRNVTITRHSGCPVLGNDYVGLSEADLLRPLRGGVLKVTRACVVSVSDFGTLGLLIKKRDLA
jgi:hypothetical protein